MITAELPPHLQYDHEHVANYLRGYPLARMIKTVLHHEDQLPRGPALLVGNHGPLAVDTGLLIYRVHRNTGRIVRGLADRNLFTNAIGRKLARQVAGVEGTPENAASLLAAGELVLVYPGGARETLRDPSQRYQLDWEGRLGFARSAIAAGVPIVPVACIGSDDLFTQVVDRETVRNSLAGRLASRFLKPEYIPPIYLPKLRPTQFHYYFGEPILPASDASADDERSVRAHQLRVKGALEALVTHGREVRRARIASKQARRAAEPAP